MPRILQTQSGNGSVNSNGNSSRQEAGGRRQFPEPRILRLGFQLFTITDNRSTIHRSQIFNFRWRPILLLVFCPLAEADPVDTSGVYTS